MKPKFSVIIPVYSELTPQQEGAAGHIHFRGKAVQRAIKSIINQQCPNWELILIDDGCADELTPKILDKFAESDERIKVIHQTNQNRAVARNRGMEEAKGEWLCWLDCDDEYSTHYLRELDAATKDFPEYSIFNFGSLIYWPDHHSTVRPVFTPKEEGKGHEWFRSGHIGAGSFIFKKELWLKEGMRLVRREDELGAPIITEEIGQVYRIPDEVNPYQFAAASLFPMRLVREEDEFRYDNTENPDDMFQDGVKRHGSSLGNPWGDDFIQFYLLTRDNLSKPLDVLLYIQYPRAHEERYEDFGEIYATD
jgi:glycosyltransferase involved in cell wall biosynthesis